MAKRSDIVGKVTFTMDGYDQTITIRREDVTSTLGAYRCVRNMIEDETEYVLDQLRKFTPDQDGNMHATFRPDIDERLGLAR